MRIISFLWSILSFATGFFKPSKEEKLGKTEQINIDQGEILKAVEDSNAINQKNSTLSDSALDAKLQQFKRSE